MNWLRRVTAYGLLCALPAVVGGCGGECQYDQLLSADQNAYFLDFKPGDYWIYRNVQNGDLDSVYFISREIKPGSVPLGDPICRQEFAIVQLKGFAGSLTYEYVVESWSKRISIGTGSLIDYKSDYDFDQAKLQNVGNRPYSQAFTITHCCLEGCSLQCGGTYMRFDRLVFARSVGIVKWEAIRHPQFGTVTYELIRSNRL